jgi:hypothetical protein
LFRQVYDSTAGEVQLRCCVPSVPCGKFEMPGKVLVPLGYRELAQIPGDTSVYDSLIVATGGSVGRFREFVTFHGENVCPAYLLAFQRE